MLYPKLSLLKRLIEVSSDAEPLVKCLIVIIYGIREGDNNCPISNAVKIIETKTGAIWGNYTHFVGFTLLQGIQLAKSTRFSL